VPQVNKVNTMQKKTLVKKAKWALKHKYSSVTKSEKEMLEEFLTAPTDQEQIVRAVKEIITNIANEK